MREVSTTLHTNGGGYWSTKAKAVRIIGLKVPYIDEDRDFGELRVYFNTEDWDCDRDGDIYTDSLFLKELREWLSTLGYSSNGVDYSESGMQGNKFVSLDVDGAFIASW